MDSFTAIFEVYMERLQSLFLQQIRPSVLVAPETLQKPTHFNSCK